MRVDREPFVESAGFPAGSAEPFALQTGFRFPVPVGTIALSLEYSGCDLEDGALTRTTAELSVQVVESLVTEVRFDGTTLVADVPRADTVVTLEDVYDAVTRPPEPTP